MYPVWQIIGKMALYSPEFLVTVSQTEISEHNIMLYDISERTALESLELLMNLFYFLIRRLRLIQRNHVTVLTAAHCQS